MSFFQPDYTPSAGGSGNYTKLQPNENRLRVLPGHTLQGWLYWTEDKKCLRFPLNKRPASTPGIRPGDAVKEFLACPVYNYDTKAIEVWEITQKQIINALYAYAQHEDYGDPANYGLTITRTGSGMETKYSVVAGVPKPLPAEIQKLADETPLNLANMLTGGSPFDASPAPGASATPEQKKVLAPVDDSDLPF